MIETRLGRRKSLAFSTFATAFFCAVFSRVTSQAMVTASSMAISLTATTMWAVLYGYVSAFLAMSRLVDANVVFYSTE